MRAWSPNLFNSSVTAAAMLPHGVKCAARMISSDNKLWTKTFARLWISA